MKSRVKLVLGWLAVAITLTISGLWAYWGSIENFHEGWYSTSLWENLFMMFFQYLLFSIVFVFLAIVTLKWKLVGLILHLGLAGFSVWFFSGSHFSVLYLLIVLPVLGLGLLYFFGEPKPLILARSLILGIPLLIIISISLVQGIKVSQRVNDFDFGLRIVEGNGVTLAWAPRGPGWPDEGITWEEAKERCKYLSSDGTTLMDEEQNIWRLPTVDEVVRSLMLHGENAGGTWNPATKTATYVLTPDKESPLWDVHSQVIYYWTSESFEEDEQRAFIIVYHGGVHAKMKIDGQDYLSFRAVKDVDSESDD
ncbi:MAG: hypothetical protein WC251_02660 [Candidatus Izemoplasmatales bacterium]|jgi:hypothetical protein